MSETREKIKEILNFEKKLIDKNNSDSKHSYMYRKLSMTDSEFNILLDDLESLIIYEALRIKKQCYSLLEQSKREALESNLFTSKQLYLLQHAVIFLENDGHLDKFKSELIELRNKINDLIISDLDTNEL